MDATAAYEPIHPKDALEKNLPPSKHLGPISTQAGLTLAQKSHQKTKDEQRVEGAAKSKPPLERILNLKEMEVSVYYTPKRTAFFTLYLPAARCTPDAL